jgi:uncharacterized protein
MTQPFSLLTLGVQDVERAAAFYEQVGFERPPGPDGLLLLRTVGTVIALHPWGALADDTTLEAIDVGQALRFRGVTMASNQPSRADVDATFARWVAAGGTPVKEPAEVFWGGYSSYVTDLDGHLWELTHNPFLTFEADGTFTVH